MSTYPNRKDTTSYFQILDGVTSVDAALFARFSSAILAIEAELGVNPSGVYTDVGARFDALDSYGQFGVLPSDITAAVALAHPQNTDTHTTSETFQLDYNNIGVILKNTLPDDLVIRNGTDTDYSSIFTKDVNCVTIKDQSGNYATVPYNLYLAVLKSHFQNTDSYTTSPYFQLNTNGIKLQDGYSKTAVQVIKNNGSLGDLYCGNLYATAINSSTFDANTLDGYHWYSFVLAGQSIDASTLDGYDSSQFLISGQNINASTLDGYDSSAFLYAGQPLDATTVSLYTSNYFQSLNSNLTGLSGIVSADGELILGTGPNTFISGKLTDGYVISLSQNKTHDNADTDLSDSSIHHTLGIFPFQAATGNHLHDAYYQPLDSILSNLASLENLNEYVILSTADSFILGKITDGYVISLSQNKTHDNADTDTALTSIHHTLGTGANQAAAGDHLHSSIYQPLDDNLTNFAGLTNTDNTVVISDAYSYFLGQISDAYVSSLSQSKTHDNADTDAALTSLHHTLGTGANQAASGDHLHSSIYQPLDGNLTNLAGLSNTDNTVVLSDAYSYFLGQISDAYVSSLSQSKTHASADTDTALTSIHHTLGTGANQAAAGDHLHNSNYQPLDGNLTNLAGLTNTDNTVVLSDASSYFLGQISDAYVSSLSQSKTHTSPDTDTAPTSLHHTLGTGANQAAAGNDPRLHYQNTDAYTTNSSFQISYPSGTILQENNGLSVRNSDNDGYVDLFIKNVYIGATNSDAFIYAQDPLCETPLNSYIKFNNSTKQWEVKNDGYPSVPINYNPSGEPIGFENRTDSYMSFDNATKTFTIAPKAPATSFTFWNGLIKYVKTSPDSIVISDDVGLHYVYYNNDTLSEQSSFPGFNKILVSIFYWNGAEVFGLGDERHGLTMDWATHGYIHNSLGTTYSSGLSIVQLTAGTGDAYTDAQVSLAEGFILDEDLTFHIVRSATPTNNFEQELGLYSTIPGKFPIYYRSGVGAANWAILPATDFACTPWNGSTGERIGYNYNDNGNWQISDGYNDGYCIASFIVATNSITEPVIAVLGQRVDDGILAAETNNTWSSLFLGQFPYAEYKPLYCLIFKTDSTFANDIKAYIQTIQDLRNVANISTGSYSATVHANLIGLTATDSHPATAISTVTTNFETILSVSDSNVQLALDKLDDHTHASLYQPLDTTLTNLAELNISDQEVILGSGSNTFSVGKISDAYVSSLSQSKTHDSADTDTSLTAIHHTLGYSTNQAAPGNHLHDAYYVNLSTIPSNYADGYVLLSDPYHYFLGQVSDAYTSSLSQSKTHDNADTDVSDSSIHHTLGVLPFQAAKGNHLHDAYYVNLSTIPSNYTDGYVLLSDPYHYFLGKISDAYTSSLSQSKTHDNVDTDLSDSSIHHTLGVLPYQAAKGNHLHDAYYVSLSTIPSNYTDGYVMLSDPFNYFLGQISDAYVSSLSQSKTHNSPDTDLSDSSIHHTLGILSYQAAKGDHLHDAYYVNLSTIPSNYTDGYVMLSDPFHYFLGKISDAYTSSLSQSKTHDNADTDLSNSSIHHTLGTLPFQAAKGDHLHDAYYVNLSTIPSNYTDGYVVLSDAYHYFLGQISDAYVSILSQSKTHDNVDTDLSDSSLHHTLGILPFQAAKGNHLHDAYYVNLSTIPANTDGTVLLSDPFHYFLGQISDAYVSTLSQSKTHTNPDTDAATTSLHHTLGTGANQAAAGNHTHSHSELTNLTSSDDHTQYVHNTIARTITANHTFNNATFGGPPFTIGASSSDVMVSGLNADKLDGLNANQFVLASDKRLHTQNTDTGTTNSSFQIQSATGVKLVNNSSNLSVRNAANDGYTNIYAKDAYFGTGLANNVYIYANTSDLLSSPSYIKFNNTTKQWEIKNDGYSILPINYNPSGEPIGFENQSDSYFTFTNSSRTFSIFPKSPATSYTVWHGLRKFVKTTTENFVISTDVGLHYLYFDSTGILAESLSFPGFDKILIAFLDWNGSAAISLLDERHGVTMDSATHGYLHQTVGARYSSGFTLTNLLVGTGNDDRNAQVSITGGVFFDEDIKFTVTRSASPATYFEQELGLSTTTPGRIPIYYRVGTGLNNWVKDSATNFICRTSGGTSATRMAYNLDTAGTWSLAQGDTNNHIAMWIFATNNVTEPVIAIMGQRQDGNLADAQINSKFASLALGNIPAVEAKILYRLILKTNLTYTNTVNSYIADIEDLRNVSNLPAGSYVATSHASLGGLTDPNAHPATAISVSTTNFAGILTTAETDVQLALDKIDDHTHAYQPLDSTLTGLASVISADGYLILSTGLDSFTSGKLTDAYVSTLSQSKTHNNVDTDAYTTSIHHTLGTGATQAAAGNDSRFHNRNADAYTTNSTFQINYSTGPVLQNYEGNLLIKNTSDAYTRTVSYLRTPVSDGYISPLRLSPGTLLYSTLPGSVEYDGYFYYTGSNSVRNILSSYTNVVPDSSSSSGKQGQFTASDAYAYVCYADNSWIRFTKDPTW